MPGAVREGTDESRTRWAFLATASRLLADSLEYEATLETVATLALPLLGSWSIVDLTEPDGSVRRLSIVHPDPALQDEARALRAGWPPRRDDPMGVPAVTRSGRAELVDDVSDDLLTRVAGSEENLRHLRALGITSLVTVPMRARGRILGAITFISSTPGRRFTAADVSLAEDVADRCALAIDNAVLHRDARALADAERARMRAEAKSQVKSEFLSTVSHELRTPLNVMAGYLELLAMEIAGPLTAMQRDYIGRLQLSEQQLLRVVEDMLNFVRLYSREVDYRPVNVPIFRVIEDVAATYAHGLEDLGLEFSTTCAPDVVAFADPAKVWQILINLVSNARKFTPAGGRVGIECAGGAHAVTIRVSDSGCGIPPAKLESVFEPFVQADGGLTRPAEGMGLGLSISRHLARDMGGDLTAASDAPTGCTFTLTLPAARQD